MLLHKDFSFGYFWKMSKINLTYTSNDTKFFLEGLYFGQDLANILERDVDVDLVVRRTEEYVLLKDPKDTFHLFLLIQTAIELLYFLLALYLYIQERLNEFIYLIALLFVTFYFTVFLDILELLPNPNFLL